MSYLSAGLQEALYHLPVGQITRLLPSVLQHAPNPSSVVDRALSMSRPQGLRGDVDELLVAYQALARLRGGAHLAVVHAPTPAVTAWLLGPDAAAHATEAAEAAWRELPIAHLDAPARLAAQWLRNPTVAQHQALPAVRSLPLGDIDTLRTCGGPLARATMRTVADLAAAGDLTPERERAWAACVAAHLGQLGREPVDQGRLAALLELCRRHELTPARRPNPDTTTPRIPDSHDLLTMPPERAMENALLTVGTEAAETVLVRKDLEPMQAVRLALYCDDAVALRRVGWLDDPTRRRQVSEALARRGRPMSNVELAVQRGLLDDVVLRDPYRTLFTRRSQPGPEAHGHARQWLDQLGTNTAAWQTALVLSTSWTGSGPELAETALALSARRRCPHPQRTDGPGHKADGRSLH